MAIDFKGCHYPKSVVLYAVAFYLRYPVSYRDLEEIMAERGVDIDHATLNRGICQTSCPLISCGVSDFRGAVFVFGVEPDWSSRLPVSGFA